MIPYLYIDFKRTGALLKCFIYRSLDSATRF